MLTVDDDGEGIPEGDRERIFEPFRRLDAAAGRAGTGLGLALVAQQVREHAATVRVETSPAGGARVVVGLPPMMPITLHRGDITRDAEADAIVNAANSSLLGGGGVDGAIHRAAGPGAAGGVPEARRMRHWRREDHRRGPAAGRPRDPHRRAGLARRQRGRAGAAGVLPPAVDRARGANGCRVVAFPAISTGVYGYPVAAAAEVAIAAMRAALDEHPEVEEVRFWLFGEPAYEAFARAIG